MVDVEVGPRPYFIKVAALPVIGETTQAELKCWHHEAGRDCGSTLLWEVRRLTDAIHQHQPMTRGLHQWLWERRDAFAAACDRFGFAWDLELIPSRTAAAARARSSREPQHLNLTHPLHDEFTVTTVGMLIMLWYCSEGLKAKRLRSRSSGLLAAILVASLPQGTAATLELLQLEPAMVALCGLRGPQAGTCVHIESVLGSSRRPNQASQLHVFNLVVSVLAEAAVCPARAACAKPFLRSLATTIGKGVAGASYTSDATKATSVDADLPSGHKRRRVDEDFKRAVLRDVTHDGRAATSRVFLRSVDGKGGSDKCKRWEESDALHYQAASWLSLGAASSFTVSVDATRLGKPGEDTEVGFLYSSEAKLGCWLPPQVLSAAMGTKGYFNDLMAPGMFDIV